MNEFHEFCWTYDFRNTMYESEPKWEKSQAGQPRPGRPAYPCTISLYDSSEMILNKISSQDQVFNTIAIKQDRKAQIKSIWVLRCPDPGAQIPTSKCCVFPRPKC